MPFQSRLSRLWFSRRHQEGERHLEGVVDLVRG